MRLHVVYRSAPVENNTARPPYYSKDACLGSFLVALDAARLPLGDVLFVNDGVIEGARRAAMENNGEVLELPRIGNAPSYRAVLSLVEWRGWPDGDLVYLVEDDYLHLPDALTHLNEAAKGISHAAFFTLYRHPDVFTRPVHQRYRRKTRRAATTIGEIRWEACWGTPLTYAARVRRLREVAGIQAVATRGSHPNDVAMWKATQRVGAHQLLHAYSHDNRVTDLHALRSLAVELVARRSLKQHLLMFPTPTLATHMTEPLISEGPDWASVSARSLPGLDLARRSS